MAKVIVFRQRTDAVFAERGWTDDRPTRVIRRKRDAAGTFPHARVVFATVGKIDGDMPRLSSRRILGLRSIGLESKGNGGSAAALTDHLSPEG
jgi:hypothetical protein